MAQGRSTAQRGRWEALRCCDAGFARPFPSSSSTAGACDLGRTEADVSVRRTDVCSSPLWACQIDPIAPLHLQNPDTVASRQLSQDGRSVKPRLKAGYGPSIYLFPSHLEADVTVVPRQRMDSGPTGTFQRLKPELESPKLINLFLL